MTNPSRLADPAVLFPQGSAAHLGRGGDAAARHRAADGGAGHPLRHAGRAHLQLDAGGHGAGIRHVPSTAGEGGRVGCLFDEVVSRHTGLRVGGATGERG